MTLRKWLRLSSHFNFYVFTFSPSKRMVCSLFYKSATLRLIICWAAFLWPIVYQTSTLQVQSYLFMHSPQETESLWMSLWSSLTTFPIILLLLGFPDTANVQELRAFLEAEGPLGGSMEWQQLQPMQSTALDSLARLPKQIIGKSCRYSISISSPASFHDTLNPLRGWICMFESLSSDSVWSGMHSAGKLRTI